MFPLAKNLGPLTSTAAAAQGYRDLILADGPLAYWRLAETTGTTFADEMATYTGTLVANGGSCTLGQTGLLTGDANKCLWTNGSYISTSGLATAFQSQAKASFEFWTNLDAAIGNRYGTMGFSSDAFMFITADTAGVGSTGFQIGSTWANMPGTNDHGVTHHWVFVYDGTQATSNARITCYRDGAALSTTTGSGTLPTTLPGTLGAFNIGFTQGFRQFKGFVDETAVYLKALSASQVLAHYNKGIGN